MEADAFSTLWLPLVSSMLSLLQASTGTRTTLDAEASDTIHLNMAEIDFSMEGLGYTPGGARRARRRQRACRYDDDVSNSHDYLQLSAEYDVVAALASTLAEEVAGLRADNDVLRDFYLSRGPTAQALEAPSAPAAQAVQAPPAPAALGVEASSGSSSSASSGAFVAQAWGMASGGGSSSSAPPKKKHRRGKSTAWW